MDLSIFAEEYASKSDDELLCLLAERSTLVPEAVAALDSEVQRRGLKRQNAIRVKRRLDTLSARYERGFLVNKVAAAQNERKLKRFDGSKEPEYSRRYKSFDDAEILNIIGGERFRFRVWKIFRDHTGHWPVLSICFHCVKALLLIAVLIFLVIWAVKQKRWESSWKMILDLSAYTVFYAGLDMVSRLMRRLDWKLFGDKEHRR